MPYLTRTDLERRYGPESVGQAAWRDGIDPDAVINQAIASAAAVVDGYLRAGHYSLPLPVVPALVTEIATDIAWYRLQTGPAVDDLTATRHRDAMRHLTNIQSGHLLLPVADQTAPATTTETDVLFDPGSPRIFSRMEGW